MCSFSGPEMQKWGAVKTQKKRFWLRENSGVLARLWEFLGDLFSARETVFFSGRGHGGSSVWELGAGPLAGRAQVARRALGVVSKRFGSS